MQSGANDDNRGSAHSRRADTVSLLLMCGRYVAVGKESELCCNGYGVVMMGLVKVKCDITDYSDIEACVMQNDVE